VETHAKVVIIGGVGMCLAEWMIDGEPSIDVWAMDIARFGDYASPHYGTVKSTENYERRFMLTFPTETLPVGRCQRTTSLYDRLSARGPQKCLVSMTVETEDIDVSNDEAILKDGECVGYVTSGGYAHSIGRSMAMGYVPTGLAKADTLLEVEINGEMYAARVIDKPLYDPRGEKIRS